MFGNFQVFDMVDHIYDFGSMVIEKCSLKFNESGRIVIPASLASRTDNLRRLFREIFPGPHEENLYAERVLRAGAKGYVMKQEAGDVLIKAVRKILNGRIHVSDAINEKLLLGMTSGQKDLNKSPLDLLSDRELEVFELTGKGNNTREIAGKLHLAVKTVESYRARIKTKLNLENATELMMHAVKWAETEGTSLE